MFPKSRIYAALSIMCLAAMPAVSLGLGRPIIIEDERRLPAVAPARRSRAATPARRYRSKNRSAKPARKSNRLTVSRRVRRKHRRAA